MHLSRTSRAYSTNQRERVSSFLVASPTTPKQRTKRSFLFSKIFNKKSKTDNDVVTAHDGHIGAKLSVSNHVLYYVRLLAVFLVSTCLFTTGYIFVPLHLLFPKNQPIQNFYRKVGDGIESLWVNFCLFCFPKYSLALYGTFPLSDSETQPKKGKTEGKQSPKILICNHSTEADWFYLWMIAKHQTRDLDSTGHVKIMLKEGIKYMPIFGWGCVLFQFIFLNRTWAQDEKLIRQSIESFTKQDSPLWILIFPEGNTVNTRSVAQCHDFAKQTNRPTLNKTLLPRFKGLEFLLKLLNEYSETEPEVFDMTMTFEGYTGEVPSWEMGYKRSRDTLIPTISSFIGGNCSQVCHIESSKFAASQILSFKNSLQTVESKNSVESWLDSRWERKEHLLTHFSENQVFPFSECGEFKLTKSKGSLKKVLSSVLICGLTVVFWYFLLTAISKNTKVEQFSNDFLAKSFKDMKLRERAFEYSEKLKTRFNENFEFGESRIKFDWFKF